VRSVKAGKAFVGYLRETLEARGITLLTSG
jgi:hypothetical protein